MFNRPNDAQVGDAVAIYKWNGSYSKQIIFTTVTKVSKRKITVDHEIAFKTSDWRLWGEERAYRCGVELVDEATGKRIQAQIDEEAVCKIIARDANEALAKIDTDRFSRYACGWNRTDLKKAIEMRKQAMLDAVAGFDQMIATLEAM